MSPFCGATVAIIMASGADPVFPRADCGCERPRKRKIPAITRIIASATTHTQPRFRPDSGPGGFEDWPEGTGCGGALVFLLHPVVCSSLTKSQSTSCNYLRRV